MDRPGALKIHSRPVPRLGGIAVAVSIFTAVFLASVHYSLLSRGLFCSGFFSIWLIGFLDDVRSLSPRARMVVQMAAGVLLWLGGWRFHYGSIVPPDGILSFFATCAVVIFFVNSFNFLDGADGIADGVAATVAAAFLVLSHGIAREPLVSAVAWSLLGASVAFLLFNFPPATIFLGDSGSTVLGFCIAFLTLDRPSSEVHSASTLALLPLILAALPLTDAAFALIRRARNRTSPLLGDRRHFYDLLLARNWPQRRVAFACYGITIALAVLAWTGVQCGPGYLLVAPAIGIGGCLLVEIGLGGLRVELSQKSPQGWESSASKPQAKSGLPFVN